MFIEPIAFIDETIDHLETLSELFADEIDTRIHRPEALTVETRICRDAQLAIHSLLPKLRAARLTQQRQALRQQMPICLNCD
jgi:hypothetical protein